MSKPKKGRPSRITEEMLEKIIYLKETYQDQISWRKVGRILQKDFNLDKPIHHSSASAAYFAYMKGLEVRKQKQKDLQVIQHVSEKKIYQDYDLLEKIKINLISTHSLLTLFDDEDLPYYLKFVISGDYQIPFHSPNCVNELFKFIKKEQPHLVIFNGDMTDFYSVSKFTKIRAIKDNYRLYQELKEEVKIYNKINQISPKTKIIKKIRGANHEERLAKNIYNRFSEIDEFLHLETMLHKVSYNEKLPIRIYISENVKDYLGRGLVIKHVGSLTKTGIFRNIDNTAYSQAVNHSHRLGIVTKKMQDDGKVIYSIECGCMCLDPLSYQLDIGAVRGFVYGYMNTSNHVLYPQIKVLEDLVEDVNFLT